MAGFFYNEDPTAYRFGSGQLPSPTLQPDGQWDAFLPSTESQVENGFDPYSCASEGTTNNWETLSRRFFGSTPDLSERWLAFHAGTRAQRGADPHVVADILRKRGTPLETDWPSKAADYDAFYTVPPATLNSKAQALADQYDFGHDIVPCTPEKMKEALKSSPLGISVRFDREENGIYRKEGGGSDNHWVTVVGYVDGQYWKIFDSAEPFLKKLDWNHSAQLVKRYTLSKRTEAAQISLMQRVIALLKQMVAMLTAKGAVEAPISPVAPSNPPVAPIPVNSVKTAPERLYAAAKASLGHDLSKKAPDERGCAESVSRLIAKVYPSFPILLSTVTLVEVLAKHPKFKEIREPVKGCVSVFPTGKKVGHAGIFGNTSVMSNDSKTGLFKANYSHTSWYGAAKTRGLKVRNFLPL